METSKPEWQWTFEMKAVPASRPRVGRWGTYYLKTYETFRREAKLLFPRVVGKFKPVACAVVVRIVISVTPPKKTIRSWPKGDVDNYAKAVLDSLNGIAFVDDDQVLGLEVVKRWTRRGEPGSILFQMDRYTELE